MADRVGVISKGELILVEEKSSADEEARQEGADPQPRRADGDDPARAGRLGPGAQADGHELLYMFDANAERTGIPSLLRRMSDLGIGFKDLNTRQSSLEDIFVSLVSDRRSAA